MSQRIEKPVDLQFAISAELCIQCGACAEDCPFHIIDMVAGCPTANPARVHHCIGCQHCLAVCPTGALSILGYNPDNSLPLPQSLPSGAQVAALMRGRRSVRVYDPEPLSPHIIAELLAVAANAPTGKNKRQCLFTVIEDRESMDVLRRETIEGLRRAVAGKRLSEGLSYFRHVVTAWDQGRDIIFRNAPHLLMVSAPPTITTPDADALIASAKAKADAAYAKTMALARQEAQHLALETREQLEVERREMLVGVRREVASLALLAAARVSGRGFGAEDDAALLDDFLDEAGDPL